MINTSLTLVLPNLSSLFQQQINQPLIPKTLNKLVRRAIFTPDQQGLTSLLFSLFTDSALSGNDLPMAKLRSQSNSTLLCADPCYLHADCDQLVVFAKDLAISQDEADRLIETIQPLLDEFGAVLKSHTSEQWLLSLSKLPNLSFSSIDLVHGKAAQNFLPTGNEADRIKWLRLWNEIQMTLFEQPVNEQRQQQGKLPINSLWFWGAGDLRLRQNTWQTMTSDNELVTLLAEQTHTKHVSPKNDFQTLTEGQHLYVWPEMNWESNIESSLLRLDNFLKEIWQQLMWGNISTLFVQIPEYGEFKLSSMDCWNFWQSK